MKLKLYKDNGYGKLVLIDFGVVSQAAKYKSMGYIVELASSDDKQIPYRVVRAEFDKLWYTLPEREKARLRDIPKNYDMSIEEKLGMLKAEIATRRKRSITVVHKRRVSFMSKVKSFFNSLIPQMEVCYA